MFVVSHQEAGNREATLDQPPAVAKALVRGRWAEGRQQEEQSQSREAAAERLSLGKLERVGHVLPRAYRG